VVEATVSCDESVNVTQRQISEEQFLTMLRLISTSGDSFFEGGRIIKGNHNLLKGAFQAASLLARRSLERESSSILLE